MSERKSKQELDSADEVIRDYSLPNSWVDQGNLFFAATEYRNAYKELQEKLSAARDALEEAFEQLKVAADNLCNCKEAECLPTDQEVQQAYSAATSVNEALETLQAFTSD